MLSVVLWGFGAVLILFPRIGHKHRIEIKRLWSRWMLSACGLRLVVQAANDGSCAPEKGELVAMNHVSFIDILALDSLRPVHFVAKSEIRTWPVIGTLCERTGTIFIERRRRHAVHNILEKMSDELRDGEVVAFFPEGTTSEGHALLPFHANLFEAAVRAPAPIRPVLLRYRQRGKPCRIPAFIGEMSLVDCAFAVLRSSAIEVHMQVLDPISSEGLSRHELATRVRAAMLACLEGS
ncbi:MAG: 1-acyl-sn-glycerol-3-phosphate acyltransferase [Betaproteobacteria bacterium]|nr:1-acyl-sn-glycerol-3-phosphate acyltransferase [Betaproteobacteria bacterium]